MTEFDELLAGITAIASEVVEECVNQHDSWGVQDHPHVYSENFQQKFDAQAEFWKAVNDARAKLGTITWDGILLEEAFEACSETEPSLRRAEYLQVAAVAVSAVQALDRAIAEADTRTIEQVEDPFAGFDRGDTVTYVTKSAA